MPARSDLPSKGVSIWGRRTFVELGQQFRWSYLPPLMVYLAAGVSGLTSIVGTFFIKDFLDLSAAFVAGLAFWAGLPWVMKMPIGHLVDLIWRWKEALVWLGAALVAASLLIMHALLSAPDRMEPIMSPEAWYVLAVILAPTGYVLQDVVADAMTVEAVPTHDRDGTPFTEAQSKAMHTTMQTLGRVSIIAGLVLVAVFNLALFSGVGDIGPSEQAAIYAKVYLAALIIPVISISGVLLHRFLLDRTARAQATDAQKTKPDWFLLGGGLVFAFGSIALGLLEFTYGQEIIFLCSLVIISFLIARLMRALSPDDARALIGTAVIIFVFRAVPLPGPGLSWFEIDELGFDEQFFSLLSLITACLTMVGLFVLRPMMANRSIAFIVVILTIAAAFLSLPNISLYYGLHEWTAARTGGVVDARFIAILDTAIESPLGQIAMVPMLAWIARSAPPHLKATFFAVMASFTNLALSASSLATRYVNDAFVVTRQVTDAATGEIETSANYDALGHLLIFVAIIGFVVPLVTVLLIQASRFRTNA
jgi:MFS family permease